MTHLPPSGFIGSMATGRGTRASRFSSACAHCFSRDVRRFSCAFAYYYPRNANHIFRREIFRFRAAFAVSPLALSRSLAVSVFKEHRRSFRSPSQALASLATLHAFQCKPITPTPANTPIYTGTNPLNNSKCGEISRNGRTDGHARQTDKLTRQTVGTARAARHAHARVTRHARQSTHTHTPARTSACTHTHAHTPTHTCGRTHTRTRTHPHAPAHTQGPPRPRTRETPNGRHLARGSKCDAYAFSLTQLGASGMGSAASLDLTRSHAREAEE